MCETGSHSGRYIQRTREGRGGVRQAVTVGDIYIERAREGRGGGVRQAVPVEIKIED